ncbi:hypothetical protein GE061_006542 [Apolygus lucorum]|uniref:Dihydrolipoyllysine-residue succinyltransferase component of 2-oxoglutarate dehydrogenase complex, mitochondrial n=1 Tax=Apolygus lucorum TaxID=248454 RepID=A0A8S9WVI8_APOLU|nr:hypothetical protein GE061_006542 [Apolygus lucorum]
MEEQESLNGEYRMMALQIENAVNAPRFPESVAEGDLRWSKKEGDAVHVDEVICEIETDKTALPVPTPVSGTLVKLLAPDGATVHENQPLFIVKAGAGPAPSKAPDSAKTPPSPKPAAAPAVKAPPAPAAPPPAPIAKPPPSSGPAPSAIPSLKRPPGKAMDSVIVKVPPDDPTKEITGTRSEFKVPMNKMRQKIGQRLKEAQNTYAMLTTFNEIDMSSIIAFRKTNQDAFSKKHGVKLGFMSAFIKAASYALQDQPVINAVIEGTEILYRDYVDISVAVATPKGLVVPVLRNVEHMNYGDIEKGLVLLAEKAKKGSLAVEDMAGGTFTITNGGVFGSLLSTPIINMPQAAILGMHATFDRPVAVKGKVEIRPMMYIALTYDHRLVDGREAVLFLRKIKAAVEDPRIIVAGV